MSARKSYGVEKIVLHHLIFLLFKISKRLLIQKTLTNLDYS